MIIALGLLVLAWWQARGVYKRHVFAELSRAAREKDALRICHLCCEPLYGATLTRISCGTVGIHGFDHHIACYRAHLDAKQANRDLARSWATLSAPVFNPVAVRKVMQALPPIWRRTHPHYRRAS